MDDPVYDSGENPQKTGDNPQETFDEILRKAAKPLDPALVVETVANSFEELVPDLKKVLDDRLKKQLAAKSPHPAVNKMIEKIKDDFMDRIFAQSVTIFQRGRVGELRGLKTAKETTENTPGASSE